MQEKLLLERAGQRAQEDLKDIISSFRSALSRHDVTSYRLRKEVCRKLITEHSIGTNAKLPLEDFLGVCKLMEAEGLLKAGEEVWQ